jgi:DNA primase
MGSCYHSGDEILFFCPKCKHHKKKLSVNLDKNKFQCWVCGYRGNSVRRLIRRFGSFTDQQEWAKIDDTIEIASFEDVFSTEQEVEEKVEQVIDLPEEFKTLCSDSLSIATRPIFRFLHQRGVSKQDIIKWKMGYCSSGEYKERVVIPSFNDDGNINYFIARSYGRDWMKYKNPPASRDIVFNELYVDFDDDLAIVEGVFDAIVAGNAVPILGSSLKEDSKLLRKIAEHDTPVYIALDPDVEAKAMRLIKKMLTLDIEVYKIDIAPYADVGEMTRKQFDIRKQNAQLMTNDSFLERAIFSI